MSNILEYSKEMGVLLGRGGLYSTVVRFKPPMCVTKQDVDYAVAVLRKAIAMAIVQ